MASYTCPACGKDDVAGLSACPCGADLSILAAISGACDAWFNRGLEAAAAGDLPQAVEWFGACCAAVPTDAAAWVAVAKVWLRLRRRSAARRALEQAARIDPQLPDVLAVGQMLGPGRGARAAPARNGAEGNQMKKRASART